MKFLGNVCEDYLYEHVFPQWSLDVKKNTHIGPPGATEYYTSVDVTGYGKEGD